MTLRLQLVSKQAATLGRAATMEFGVQGGRLGRARDNDWCLPDDHRFLSAHHARIFRRDGEWQVEDTSSNGIWHNRDSQPIGRGNSRRLAHGDRLRFGDYIARVSISEEVVEAPALPATENHLGFPFDIRSLLDGSGAFRRPVTTPAADPPSPLREEGDLPVPPPNAPPPLTAEQRALDSLLNPRPVDTSPTGALPHTPLVALGRGLGLDFGRLSTAEQARLFTVVGQLLRECVLGLMGQLRQEQHRAAELGASAEPATGNPNPLQCPVSTEDALRRLLAAPSSRFLGPVEAVRDAFEALDTAARLHEEATRAGLDHLLQQLDPEQLAARFNRSLAPHQQAGDTSRFWSLYPDLHRAITQRRRDGLPYVFTEGYALAREAARQAAEIAMGATTDVNETVNPPRGRAG